MKVSVVVPVYNAERSIADLVREVRAALAGHDLEIVLVNDGSRDGSDAICEKLARETAGVRYLCLRRNFGEHNAVMCGLNHATGDFIAIIDDDFQNPPAEIPALLQEAQKGYDVVYSRYTDKKHSWFRNFGSRFNDFFATRLLGKPPDLYLSSFKVIRKEVVDEIVKYKGPFPYIDGLILRATDQIGTALVSHRDRRVGKSNYTLIKLVQLYMNMFFNFSIVPLRIFTFGGFLVFVTGAVFTAAFITEKLLHPEIPVGWTSLITAILTLSGFQVMFLGLIGEYLGKQYLDQNKTPQWVIRKEILKKD
ncbi:MAG: glycosyl transferase family 2 [Candidatus Lindowbacteria bacterium RIFCSPLOWO2_12_FULL_62_27]|nr:MAG: glycosyl transferase family 2 [Candidatus Lindowbacteria bacterium RIFCSPLOWO2_02_FULL_62_12]OGH62487.1 MAG: glycosyl transferase family 2 [Candidatus Lindowbacteria bacterium RIFCSPLOWO2_12_FULL_62_27]